jgi:hypothetical protein
MQVCKYVQGHTYVCVSACHKCDNLKTRILVQINA